MACHSQAPLSTGLTIQGASCFSPATRGDLQACQTHGAQEASEAAPIAAETIEDAGEGVRFPR